MHRITFKSALIALATTTCMTAVSFTANAQKFAGCADRDHGPKS